MFNENSTNESPIPSPSKNFKEIQIKNQKNTIDNFSSFAYSFLKNQKMIFPQEKKEEKKSGIKPIKRILKKIIKKKGGHKPLILDFDFILKEIFNNKNLVNNVYTVEKKHFPDFGKKFLGKKRKKEKEKSDKFILDFTLNLYEDEIIFNAKQRKENFKVANIIYEKSFSPEFFKSYKILTSLNLEKTFDFIQKSFELDYDQIILEENELRIKLMINIMDVLTEEINFEIPMIKMASQDEVLSLKESVKFLEQERNTQKKEIITLNETLEEIKKR